MQYANFPVSCVGCVSIYPISLFQSSTDSEPPVVMSATAGLMAGTQIFRGDESRLLYAFTFYPRGHIP